MISNEQIYTEHEIILCNQCKGLGVIEETSTICNECNGTGRLYKTKKWQEFYEPFDFKRLNNKNIRFKFSGK